MDTTNKNPSPVEIGSIDPPEARSEENVVMVGEKRQSEEEELGVPLGKRARSETGPVVNVKKAAEIVMVLAAMGQMRGGRKPTAAEKEMMVEAREKLAKACEAFAPKDVFPRDAFESVIEDLGLNQLKEQKLGFHPTKMSIAERFLFTKHKRMLPNLGAAAESQGALHSTGTPLSDRPSHAKVSGVGLQPAAPAGRGFVGNSTSLPYQLPASEVRTHPLSSGVTTSPLGGDSSNLAVHRAERLHFRPEARLSGSSPASATKVNPSGEQAPQKPPGFSQQVQSGLSGKAWPDNKVLSHPSFKLESPSVRTTPRLAAHVSKSLPVQATSGHFSTIHQHVRGMNITQGPPLSNPHIEIGKIVQKVLQPQIPVHPTWTPPSRDYMNKSLPCQVCKITIDEMENALVCDACEKGYHLKCLDSNDQKGIPKGEWHCSKCLSLSNGKPIPPKYGRVTRNMGAPKVHSNTPAVKPSPEKKSENFGEKETQSKIIVNGSADLQSLCGSMCNNHNNPKTDSNAPNRRESQGIDVFSSRKNMDDRRPFENGPDDAIRSTGTACTSVSADSCFEESQDKSVSEPKGLSPGKSSGTGSKILDYLQASSDLPNNGQESLPDISGGPFLQCHGNNLTVEVSEGSHCSKNTYWNLTGVCTGEERGLVQNQPTDVAGNGILVGDHPMLPSDVSDNVDWIGDVLHVVDEKIYYLSCCVDGVVYKAQDHALIYSSNSNDKLIPSKLQAMWEDRKTRSKWVIANRCYFHDDLPEGVGRPCSPESNEVCESNHSIITMAGLIRGPCEVLSSGKYIEESQRRSRLGSSENDGLRPLFLCKWFFDESKGVFRDVSS